MNEEEQNQHSTPDPGSGIRRRSFLKKAGYFTFSLTIADGIAPFALADPPFNPDPACASRAGGISGLVDNGFNQDNYCLSATGAIPPLVAKQDDDCGLLKPGAGGGNGTWTDNDCVPKPGAPEVGGPAVIDGPG